MAIFTNRPLAAACCLSLLSVTLCLLLSSTTGLLIALFAALAFAVLLVLILWRGYSYKKLFLALLVLGVLLGSARSGLYTARSEMLTAHIGSTSTVLFTVEEVNATNPYSAELTVKIEEIDGVACRGKAVFRADFASPFYRGDRVSGSFSVQPLTYGNYFENQHYQYRARGCSVVLLKETTNELTLLEHTQSKALLFLENLRMSLCDKVSLAVKGEAGNLLNAMLLGARDGITEKTTRDFQRAGVMHLLAISGLHVGILAAICERLLCALGVHKRIRVLATLLLMLGYLFLAGCTPSILRAVLMLTLFYLAFFFKSEADPLTSLFLVAALILMWQPYAVFSTSYQLTVLATFGILAFERARRLLVALFPQRSGWQGLLFKATRSVLASLLVSLFAGLAILPVQWLTFGEIATITPLSNLFLIPLAAPFLLFGIGVLLFYPTAPFALACRGIGNLILSLTELLAKPSTVVSLAYDFVPYLLIPCAVGMMVLLLLDLKKRWWLTFAPMLTLFLGFVICLISTRIGNTDKLFALYRMDGKNESLALIGNDGTVLCDLSSGNTTQLVAGWELLRDEGATDLDVLVLTHYHKAQAVALSRFCDRTAIHALWLPMPQSENDLLVFEALYEIAQTKSIPVTLYPFDRAITVFGKGELYVSAPIFRSRSNEPAFTLTAKFGETVLYYESAAYSEYRRGVGNSEAEINTDLYILGAHGPVPHDKISLGSGKIGTVLIPSEEALRLLDVKENCSYFVFEEKYRFLLQ